MPKPPYVNPDAHPQDAAVYTPDDQQVFEGFRRSPTWHRIMDVLVVTRGELFGEMDKARGSGQELAYLSGKIAVIQELLETFPMRMVEYRRAQRSTVQQRATASPASDAPMRDPAMYTGE